VVSGSSLILQWVGRDLESGIAHYAVYLNGRLVTSTKNTSCEIQGFIEGVNNVTVVAFDNAGNNGTSEIAVIIDNKAPTASLTCLEGDRVRGTVTLRFNVSDENLAETLLYVDDSMINVTGKDSYKLFTEDLDDGYHVVKIVAVDKAGNTNSSNISIMVDNSKPVLSIISPPEDSIVSDSLAVRLSIFDINPVRVIYKIDDSKPVNITGSITDETAFKIDTTKLEDGVHTINLTVIDVVGNRAEKLIRVNVDNTAPKLEIRNPVNGSFLKGVVPINLVGDDANFESCELYIFGNLTKRWRTSGTQVFNWDTKNYEDGRYVIKASVTDKAGHTVKRMVIVNVDNTAPKVLVKSPREGTEIAGTWTIRFEASDEKLAKVLLYIDGSTFDVTGKDSYKWYTNSLSDGLHRIRVVAIDEAGNMNEVQIIVTLVNQRLMVESMLGLVLCAFLIAIWPLILTSKTPIL